MFSPTLADFAKKRFIKSKPQVCSRENFLNDFQSKKYVKIVHVQAEIVDVRMMCLVSRIAEFVKSYTHIAITSQTCGIEGVDICVL